MACELLDWQPKVDLEEGLDRTIHYFRKVVAGEAAPVEESVFVM